MNTTTLSTIFNNKVNFHESYDFIDITTPVLSIAEFAERINVVFDEECLLLCQRIHHLKDTDWIHLDRTMLEIIGFQNTMMEKVSKKGDIKLIDKRLDFSNAKRCLSKVFPCGDSFDDNDHQWIIIKLVLPERRTSLQHGGNNKEEIWIRRQALEIFNATAMTSKSHRNMIFLISMKNLVFDYQYYFSSYELKKKEFFLTEKDDNINQLMIKIDTIIQQNDDLLDKVSELKDVLDDETEDKVVNVKTNALKEHIIVLQNNINPTELRVICGQNRYTRQLSLKSTLQNFLIMNVI
jgi:hypothetical protein